MARTTHTQDPAPRYSLLLRWRMLWAKDAILGNKLSAVGKILGRLVIALLSVFILWLVLRIFRTPIVAETEAALEAAKIEKAGEFLGVLLSILTLIITAITAIQVYMMKDIHHMDMSQNIFDDNQTFRRDMHKAHQQLRDLSYDLGHSDKFDDAYLLPFWEDLRAFAFHYEYMGYLVLRERLNFDIVFDTVAYPNWLIDSPEAEKVIAAGRKNTPDFWNGSEYLYLCYELRRKYNWRKASRAALHAWPAARIRAAKKSLCKAAVLAGEDPTDPLYSDRSPENALKNLWLAKAAFRQARSEWREHFAKLPK